MGVNFVGSGVFVVLCIGVLGFFLGFGYGVWMLKEFVLISIWEIIGYFCN